jgi:hypothetical protein
MSMIAMISSPSVAATLLLFRSLAAIPVGHRVVVA